MKAFNRFGRRLAQGLCGVLLVSSMLCVSGCSAPAEPEISENTEQEDTMSIGLCFDSFVIERWEKDRDVFVATARDLGATVNVQNANGEVQEQIKQIEYFINKGVDAIVIISIDGDALTDVVKKARNKGIKVVSYDRLIPNANTDLYVSFDNYRVGAIMAENMILAGMNQKKVVMLQGPTTDHNVQMIEKGFVEVMDNKGVEIVASMNAEGWKAEEAADFVYAHPEMIEDVDGIMCGNDNLATAVTRVLSEKRKAGKLLLVGQDADLEACQRIVEGIQTMTVYKPVEKEAQRAAEATVALIKGEPIEDVGEINDGSFDIPSIVLEPLAVTKANIDRVIIESGFHLRDEVYMNVHK